MKKKRIVILVKNKRRISKHSFCAHVENVEINFVIILHKAEEFMLKTFNFFINVNTKYNSKKDQALIKR